MDYLIFSDNNLLVKKTNNNLLTLPSDISSIRNHLTIVKEDNAIFVAYIDKAQLDENWTMIDFRQALAAFDQRISQQMIYYLQLIHYYKLHHYCGICSHSLTRQKNSLFLICEKCQHEVYPKLAPSIIVRIMKDNKILLARSPHFPPGMWGLIAGFVELGESLEDALHREVMEEVGITVENIQYWGSQSWPMPTSSLMIGFTAEYKSGELKIDQHEIEQAGFFDKEEVLEKLPRNSSIARMMIDDYLK